MGPACENRTAWVSTPSPEDAGKSQKYLRVLAGPGVRAGSCVGLDLASTSSTMPASKRSAQELKINLYLGLPCFTFKGYLSAHPQ